MKSRPPALSLRVLLACLGLAISARADEPERPSEDKRGDVAWLCLQKIAEALPTCTATSSPGERERKIERLEKEYRKVGLGFWRDHSEDSRRYRWLVGTLRFAPRYWVDPQQGSVAYLSAKPEEIDEGAKAQWEQVLEHQLKPEVLRDALLDEEARLSVYDAIVAGHYRDAYTAIRLNEPLDADGFSSAILEYLSRPAADFERAADWTKKLFQYMELRKVSPERQQTIVARFATLPAKTLQTLARERQRFLKFYESPLELDVTTRDGLEVSLKRWRGKVVLIDCWNVTCSSCIEAMPRIKAVYDRYHGAGFEVVGLCFVNGKEDSVKAEKIIARLGILWPQSIQEMNASNALIDEFGLNAFPSTWLLDKKGRLVTTDTRGGQLERDVRKLTAD